MPSPSRSPYCASRGARVRPWHQRGAPASSAGPRLRERRQSSIELAAMYSLSPPKTEAQSTANRVCPHFRPIVNSLETSVITRHQLRNRAGPPAAAQAGRANTGSRPMMTATLVTEKRRFTVGKPRRQRRVIDGVVMHERCEMHGVRSLRLPSRQLLREAPSVSTGQEAERRAKHLAPAFCMRWRLTCRDDRKVRGDHALQFRDDPPRADREPVPESSRRASATGERGAPARGAHRGGLFPGCLSRSATVAELNVYEQRHA